MRGTCLSWVFGGLAAIGCAAAPAGDARTRLAVALQDPAEMDAWMKAGMPGEPHKALAMLAGAWTAKTKVWMNPQAPEESDGACDNELLFGGRFLVHEYEGKAGGMDFEGLGILGYDNIQKCYTSLWTDSMSTMIAHSTGQSADGGKTIVFHGTYTDPLGRPTKDRTVFTRVDADHYTVHAWTTVGDQPERKMIELAFTRKAEPAPKDAPKDAPK